MPSFEENLARAEHVYVFRIVSQELTDSDIWPSKVRGRVAVVRTLLGGQPSIQQLEFTMGAHCGIKLAVGRFYLVALENDTTSISLVPGDQSVLDVTDGFKDGSRSNPDALGPVLQYLSGEPLPKDYPGAYRLSSTLSCLPPPAGT
ncbi:hypothetical protein [Arenimonas sp. MALMAid1274]|uniref:hypothetical protein n=1 Tax=Arenimonas sp. MALMAid1274 TaxID=3411630 RepID=UPI003B9E353A